MLRGTVIKATNPDLSYKRYQSANATRNLVRQINLNKGEIKKAYFSANALSVGASGVQVIDITGITQGVEDDERIGRRIRVYSVDIRTSMSTRNLDCYLIQGLKNTMPTYSDFAVTYAGHLVQNSRYEFRELKFLKSLESLTSFEFYKKTWKNGLPVYYDGPNSSDGARNCLFLVFRNTTGAAIGSNHFSVVLTYRD